jgi:hypothetical protein
LTEALAKFHRSLGSHFALVSSSAGEEVFSLASAATTRSEEQSTVVVEVLLCTPDLGSVNQQACPEK